MNRGLFCTLVLISKFLIVGIISCLVQDNVKRDGNNFTQTTTLQQSTDTKTIYTYTIKETGYPIWITKNGRCYIVKVSKNGNEYKQYLDKEICIQICKELNVEYKESD